MHSFTAGCPPSVLAAWTYKAFSNMSLSLHFHLTTFTISIPTYLNPRVSNIGNYKLVLHLTTINFNLSYKILSTCVFCYGIAQWNKYQETHQSWFHCESQTFMLRMWCQTEGLKRNFRAYEEDAYKSCKSKIFSIEKKILQVLS